MTDRLPGSFSLGKLAKIKPLLSNIILAVLAALVVLGLYTHFHKKSPSSHIVTGLNLTNAQKLSQSTKFAQDNIKKQDYQQAVDAYYGAASNAYLAKNYMQAKNILQECIKQVPDKDVPWYIYNSLALIAKQLKDTSLEMSSLQTAINKASATPGVSQATILGMQKDLQGI